jgi:hypothetical protein
MMSLYTLGSMGTTPLGALIVGAAIDHWSPRISIGLGASSAVVAGLVLTSPLRHTPRLPQTLREASLKAAVKTLGFTRGMASTKLAQMSRVRPARSPPSVDAA